MALLSFAQPAEFGRNLLRPPADSTWKRRAVLLGVGFVFITAYVLLGLQLAPPRTVDHPSTTSAVEMVANQNRKAQE